MTETEREPNQPEANAAPPVETIFPVDEHVEEIQVGDQKVRRKGIYLLPNLFTTGALFSGFYATVAATQHNFEHAAIALIVAGILDGLDGRIARLTNTSSEFGVQYDSMSDLVSFGVAPSILMFNWALVLLGKLGWAIAFAYVACAALRLARFNAQVKTADKRYFVGLASPAAAGLIATMVWTGFDVDVGGGLALLVGMVTLGVALLMVSNVRYQSMKGIDFRGRVPFVFILVMVMLFAIITIDPPRVLLLIGVLYAASGPLQTLFRIGFKRFGKEKSAQ
ncbi:CDP-diacylglycerol--serine O-phosphatidyltransferase [Halioxenophilus sp. WMMB6]|uniref:CDP-diacylglycerol--serine O-phosphatidyltransferase n=1 Tax=Halioxenophilus sp. WMMB6 TaxID=3073815 RepID=UPI00295ED661|nr:CDP-diacylglycerol--serine O-phosphatidyltransferase [Halioxenophilus sp. WMMB6]